MTEGDVRKRLVQIRREIQMVRNETHPLLIQKKLELEEQRELEMQQAQIFYENRFDWARNCPQIHGASETGTGDDEFHVEEHFPTVTRAFQINKKRIEVMRKRKLEQNKEELETKLRTTKEDLLKDIEDCERLADLEFNNAEIGKIHYVQNDSGKKTLRGRGGGILIEPPSYFNATPKPSVSAAPSTIFTLLSDAEIALDIKLFTQSSENVTPAKKKVNNSHRLIDVHMNKMRLTYEGKAYKQGEEVTVENNEYGKFPARIDVITEIIVTFKATQAWDTRQIHASCADLAEGRVIISKKRSN